MQGQGYYVVGHRNLFYTRAKVFILRHRKIRPCIVRCGVLFLSNDYPFPRINTGFLERTAQESPWSRGIRAKARQDKTNCLFMPDIE